MTHSSTKKRVTYFSRLKVAACLAVVILHTFYAADAFAVDANQHMLALVIRNLMMWSVPCFVMVTGALLFDPNRSVTISKIYKKYLPRVVIALVFFSMAFAIFDAILLKKPMAEAVMTGVNAIFLGTGWKHMWYLYLIIGIYLVLPFFRMVTRSATEVEIRYLILILFIFQVIVPTVQAVFNVSIPFYICFFTVYPLFLLAGYAIHNEMLNIKLWVAILFVLIGIGSIGALTYLGVYREAAWATSLITPYSFPGTVLFSIGVFAIYKECGRKPCKSDSLMKLIDKCSFGIYLLHMVVLKVFAVKFRPDVFGKPYWLVIEVAAAFLIPFIVVIIYSICAKPIKKLIKG